MKAKWIRRWRTFYQAAGAAIVVVLGIQLGPVIDALDKVGFPTTGLGLIPPETAAALIGLLGTIAGALAALNQVADRLHWLPSAAVRDADGNLVDEDGEVE